LGCGKHSPYQKEDATQTPVKTNQPLFADKNGEFVEFYGFLRVLKTL